jgi:hypothetical protein
MARGRVAYYESMEHEDRRDREMRPDWLALSGWLAAALLMVSGCADRVPPFERLVAVHGVPKRLAVTRDHGRDSLLVFEMRYTDAYGTPGGPRTVRAAAGDAAALKAELERDPAVVTAWVEARALEARRGDSTLVAYQLARGDRVLLRYAEAKAGEEARSKAVLPLAGIAVLGLAAFLWNLRGTQRKQGA